MKIFGYNITKRPLEEVDIAEARKWYKTCANQYVTFEPRGSIRYKVVGRHGKWLILATNSTRCTDYIKSMDMHVVDECCDSHGYWRYRLVTAEEFGKTYSA